MSQTKTQYNLEERTALLGESVIKLCLIMTKNQLSNPLVNQLIRSSTSVGANYMEANGASSKKDFINKIFICKKECQETKHWLRTLSVAEPKQSDELRKLWRETQELTLIFQKIASSARSKL